MNFGPTELIIILVIVLVLFGVGRIGKIGGEVGSAVANFRKGVKAADTESTSTDKRAEVSS
ncbi:MAG: twin-arginine translocase TatA/TatE family subunit [Pleurocapsa minor GSE-CHR-MK-17-07R]|nr:twin-arginine translocase TatA/TatE family subunit [Pleurocapsa minor GSE-CHR-MK 17-07R]